MNDTVKSLESIKNAIVIIDSLTDKRSFLQMKKDAVLSKYNLWIGGFLSSNRKDEFYIQIPPESEFYERFAILGEAEFQMKVYPVKKELINQLSTPDANLNGVFLALGKALFNNTKKTFSYKSFYKNDFDISIAYFPRIKKMRVSFVIKDIEIIHDEGYIRSSNDFHNINLDLQLMSIPFHNAKLYSFEFLFPPNYSNKLVGKTEMFKEYNFLCGQKDHCFEILFRD